jgi:hypothetical protein
MTLLLYWPLFVFLVVALFTLPGIFFVHRLKSDLGQLEILSLSTIVGYVLFTIAGYFGLMMGFPYLPLIISAGFVLATIHLKLLFLPKLTLNNKLLLLILTVFIVGIIGQLLVISPSGIYRDQELVFWSSHGHDGMWHIALMQEFFKGYPFQNPIFAGERLVNYHFFFDITAHLFNRFFYFGEIDLYFRFFPLLFSILLGSSAFSLGKIIGRSNLAGIWAMIFTYFAGSFGYILTLLRSQTLGGESIFWASQIQSSIGNPPQIISLFLVLGLLIIVFYLFEQKLRFKSAFKDPLLWAAVIILGSLITFKVYASVVLFIGLGISSLVYLFKYRNLSSFILLTLSGVVSLILYLPNASKTTGFLIFEPWWFIRTMIVVPDKLDWLDHELRRQTYISENNLKRVIYLETIGFLIFFVGNLGTRVMGLLHIIKNFRTYLTNPFYILLLTAMLSSLILPLLFLQKGVAANSIQFFQYLLLLLGIISGVLVASVIARIKYRFLQIIVSILIILVTVPTQLGLLLDFYSRPPVSKITPDELQALKFLKEFSDKDGIILTAPYNRYVKIDSPTPSIWAWSDTAYIPALASRRTYFSDREQSDIMGYEVQPRIDLQKLIFEEANPEIFNILIQRSNSQYLYFPIRLKPAVELDDTSLVKVYSNPEIEIWKIK